MEFALAVPALLGFVIGIAQLGMLFFANADVRNAVAAGTRLASVHPDPGDARILAEVEQGVVGLEEQYIIGPSIERGTDANDNDYVDISMSYSAPLDFIFFETPPITLTNKQRVFIPPARDAGDCEREGEDGDDGGEIGEEDGAQGCEGDGEED